MRKNKRAKHGCKRRFIPGEGKEDVAVRGRQQAAVDKARQPAICVWKEEKSPPPVSSDKWTEPIAPQGRQEIREGGSGEGNREKGRRRPLSGTFTK